MTSYPRLDINVDVIEHNVRTLLARCVEWKVRPVFVTKGFLADFPLVKLLYETGVRNFADSNLVNLLRMRALFGKTVRLVLIRLPMGSELRAIQENGVIPFVSHRETLERLNTIAGERKTLQRVVLALESGDAREGFLPEETPQVANLVERLPWISVEGIGSTLACLSGVLPDGEIMKQLVELKETLAQRLGQKEFYLSVGGTTFLEVWENGGWVKGVDEIRFGEAFLFGSDISRKRDIPWLRQGAFTIWAEVVEVRAKEVAQNPSRGFDAFGEITASPWRGKRKRMLLALGKQDVDERQLYFFDSGVKIIGATSNYLVMDVEESDREYRVGDVLGFRAGYGAVLRAFLSPYVEKVYVKGEGVAGE